MIRKNIRRRKDGPDLGPVLKTVSERVGAAMLEASRQLTEAGIPHSLIGALAVGAHGHPRATDDVDFLVGEEAFIRSPKSAIVTLHPKFPVLVGDVIVDAITVADDEMFLDAAIDGSIEDIGVPIVGIGPLVYLKLKAGRAKDRGDVVELIKAGIDTNTVEEYLDEHAPHLVAKFVRLCEMAEREE